MPRSNSIFRLEPFQSAPARFNPIKQKTVATEQRKKTISIAGIWATCFTKTLAKEKASVDKNIARTPSVKIVRSPLKPVKRIVFLLYRRNRSQRRSPAYC